MGYERRRELQTAAITCADGAAAGDKAAVQNHRRDTNVRSWRNRILPGDLEAGGYWDGHAANRDPTGDAAKSPLERCDSPANFRSASLIADDGAGRDQLAVDVKHAFQATVRSDRH